MSISDCINSKLNCLGVTDEQMADLVIRTISCSNNDLATSLQENIGFLVKRHNRCSTQIDFVNLQLDLLIDAQQFVYNRVNYSDTKSTSKSLTRNKARTDSESQSQQTAQGSACSFSDATSISQFTRTSVDRAISKSDTIANATGVSDSNAYDRSVATASGYSATWDTSRSISEGDGVGSHHETSDSEGKSYQRTAPEYADYRGLYLGEIDPNVLRNLANTIIDNLLQALFSIRMTLFPDFTITIGGPASLLEDFTVSDPVGGDYQVPRIELPTVLLNGCCCNDPIDSWGDCTRLGYPDLCAYGDYPIKPTYGRSFSANYNLSLSASIFGFGFTVNQSWSAGGNFQQSEVHTQSCSHSLSQSETSNDYTQTDWARSKGVTETKDVSQNTSDIHSVSDSQRVSHSDTQAASSATGDSYATSESEADRAAHSEARNSGQGSSWSKTKSRNDGLSMSDSRSDSVAENLSDISRALGEMFDLLSDEKRKLETLLNGKQSIAIGRIENCNKQYAIPPDPVNNAMIRSMTAIWHRNKCDESYSLQGCSPGRQISM